MKITKARLKWIIREETHKLEEAMTSPLRTTVAGDREIETSGEAIAATERRFGLPMPFSEWIAEVESLGYEFDRESPNPYDAWMSRRSPQDYISGGALEES